MRSFFTYEQWRWIKERYDEGYSMETLAEFLGIDRRTIRTGFVRMGFYPGVKTDLPPLIERREEFLKRGINHESRQDGGKRFPESTAPSGRTTPQSDSTTGTP